MGESAEIVVWKLSGTLKSGGVCAGCGTPIAAGARVRHKRLHTVNALASGWASIHGSGPVTVVWCAACVETHNEGGALPLQARPAKRRRGERT